MTLLSRIAALLLALAPLPTLAQAMDPSELPPVDSVFQLSAAAPARDRIELRWKIAPGYYLYRHRTKVDVLGTGFQAGALQTIEQPGDRSRGNRQSGRQFQRGELASRVFEGRHDDKTALRQVVAGQPGCAGAIDRRRRREQLETQLYAVPDLGRCAL